MTPETQAVYNQLRYIGESQDARLAIAETIAELPEDVREFALDGGFVTVGDPAAGFYFTGEYLRQVASLPWLIVLSDNVDWNDFHGLAAHEIAHLWLGHDTGIVGDEAFIECEEAAAALVRAWGFRGMGTRPSSAGLTEGDA